MPCNILGDFAIPDDSGILALVDASKYVPYIGENWSLSQIMERFRLSMKEQSLLIWSPGCEGNWRVRVYEGESNAIAYRSASGSIRVCQDKLYLVSYDSLTMAAQYEDEQIPQQHEIENGINLPNGLYQCQVSQLFSPEDYMSQEVYAQQTPHYSVSFVKANEVLEPWSDVMWLNI
jgi:hypothetical protein